MVVQRILSILPRGRRRLIALAGAPASGKSTMAERLCNELPNACVVPMDGFHLDNEVLQTRGLLARKGAPMTFDLAGFQSLLQRLAAEETVPFPIFDRQQDKAIPNGGMASPEIETVVVEGNYLLLDVDGWRELMPLWDLSIFLDVAPATLRERLMQRWLDHGFSKADAITKAEGNDLPNALMVAQRSLPADVRIQTP